MIHTDPSGRFVAVADAGLDRMYVYGINLDTGRLFPAKKPFTTMTAGSAPRHFQFSADGLRLYILCEQDSKVVVANFDAKTGDIAPQQAVSSLTAHFRGSTLAAGILFSPDEHFLYVSNRLGDSLAVFQVAKDGGLTLVDEIWTHADYGRASNLILLAAICSWLTSGVIPSHLSGWIKPQARLASRGILPLLEAQPALSF